MVAQDMNSAAPRINSQLLSQRVGQNVTIVGKVKQPLGGTFAHLEGPDGGDIVIDRSGSSRNWGSEYVEVVGTVAPDRTVKETRSTDFGNDFDLKQYNELVLLANGPMRQLFQ